VQRRPPYDSRRGFQGTVDCSGAEERGTGRVLVNSHPGNGFVEVQVSTFAPIGKAEGRAGVGINYSAPREGRIRITADVTVDGAELLWFVNLPVLGTTAIVSVESWAEVAATRLHPVETLVGKRKFANRLRTPLDIVPTSPLEILDLLKDFIPRLPSIPLELLKVEPVLYDPPRSFPASVEVDVEAGDRLFICAGVRSKVVTTGPVPGVAGAVARYQKTPSGATIVDRIRIRYL
jgi:hypothetical protein